MKMTKEEYEKLISSLEFLNDKVEACYKRETDKVIKCLKEEYKQYVIRYWKNKKEEPIRLCHL